MIFVFILLTVCISFIDIYVCLNVIKTVSYSIYIILLFMVDFFPFNFTGPCSNVTTASYSQLWCYVYVVLIIVSLGLFYYALMIFI